MHATTRMPGLAGCLTVAALLVGLGGAHAAATAAPTDAPTPTASYVPEEPVEERGPVVERDADDDPGELPTEREVPPQSDAPPVGNDTITDADLRRSRDLEIDGELGGSAPAAPATDRIRGVLTLLGTIVLVAVGAAGLVLWRRA